MEKLHKKLKKVLDIPFYRYSTYKYTQKWELF